MSKNAESALQIVLGLEHAKIQGRGTGPHKSTTDILAEARTYQAFLNEGALGVFVLTSLTYRVDPDTQGLGLKASDFVVGIFATREAAESYRDNAIGPVSDGVITEWLVEDQIVGPDGKHLEEEEE